MRIATHNPVQKQHIMLEADDKLAITQGGIVPQFMHLVVGWILLYNQQMLQEVGLNHNAVKVRWYSIVSSHWQLCISQLISTWRNLQTKDLQWVSLYGRGAAEISTT